MGSKEIFQRQSWVVQKSTMPVTKIFVEKSLNVVYVTDIIEVETND